MAWEVRRIVRKIINNWLNGYLPAILFAALLVFISCSEDSEVGPPEPDTEAPTVNILDPLEGETLYDETPILAQAHDNDEIAQVLFYIDDELIAADSTAPYEQMWYIGYWSSNAAYRIIVIAEDISDNLSLPDSVPVRLAAGTRYTPEIIGPEDHEIFTTPTEIIISWHEVPGARQYILRIKSPEANFAGCHYNEPDVCYLYLELTSFTISALSAEHDVHFAWQVQAYRSGGHYSNWSEERHFIIR
jgi:hypothetical protein